MCLSCAPATANMFVSGAFVGSWEWGRRRREHWRTRQEERESLLPVIIPAVSLRQLGVEVDEVAGEEEVVLGRHGQGVAHEGARVDCEGGRECAGDTEEEYISPDALVISAYMGY